MQRWSERLGRQAGRAGAWVGALAVAALAGCGSVGGLKPDSPNEAKVAQVTELAEARWKALIARDVDKAYGYLSPASREVVTLAQYKASTRPAGYRAVRVDKVSCEGEVCKVSVELTYDHRMMKGIVTPVQESWVLDKGRYWLVYRG